MTNKTEFQIRILKKYGVLPIFEGDIDFKNVKSPEGNETFSAWCDRVLQKDSSDVWLYGLHQPTGQKQIENLKDDGQLIALIRSYAKNKLRKKLKSSEEIEELDFSNDDDMFLIDRPLEKVVPWYKKLEDLKAPECLASFDSKDMLLLEHSDHNDFSTQHGTAARHIIVLNDVAMYAEKLFRIFASSGFEATSEVAGDLQIFADDLCQITAFIFGSEDYSEFDKKNIEREHVVLILKSVDGLFDEINDLVKSLSLDVEDMSPAERFIAKSMIFKPTDALKRCADMLREL